jgi:hypothetical protein
VNRAGVIKAAFYAVIAMGDEPSSRSVQAMCERICGKRLRTADILVALRDLRNSVTIGQQPGSGAVARTTRKTLASGSATVTDGKPLRARVAKELNNKHTLWHERIDPKPLSEPFGLADWFWAEAARRDLIAEHQAPARDREVRGDIPAAKLLLAAHDVVEIQSRAARYLDAIVAEQIRLAPNLRGLSRAWTWKAVAPSRELVGAGARNGSAPAGGWPAGYYVDTDKLN